MKKVRFETPTKLVMDLMHEYECHSPRPFVDRQTVNINYYNATEGRPVVFSNDPVHRFENDNSLPYPTASKTSLDVVRDLENKKVPSSDLDLSMLDCSNSGNRIALPKTNIVSNPEPNHMKVNSTVLASHKILTSIENTSAMNPSIRRDNDFFLKKDNLGKISLEQMHQQLGKFKFNNEHDPLQKKSQIRRYGTPPSEKENCSPRLEFSADCNCHHCLKIPHVSHNMVQHTHGSMDQIHKHLPRMNCNIQNCMPQSKCSCICNTHIVQPTCGCSNRLLPQHTPLSPSDAVDKKTWAIEKYEKSREGVSTEVEKSNSVFKEKREPTVSDLFKIIKLQNEQLQLLQEKVDKFISSQSNGVREKQVPVQNFVTEQLAVQTVNSEQHKISIGVMTSFEMVRTSTVINKEIVKQCEAQIQCNRSQISIKEVVSKKHGGNLNFLEGISPVSKNTDHVQIGNVQAGLNMNSNESCGADNVFEDKTLNELSLYNVQVDNTITPMMSPEQSLYLDIRDYSESDSGSDDQSNVGWTYYNKVMTHVNGMLHDSDMPSSASALYRHTKQRCMQVDKSNVSVAKRVTFGDDPLGVQQHHMKPQPPTDTSLKMNQLAAKYLKHTPTSHTPSPKGTDEMSFATRKYMERHKLLHGANGAMQEDIPRFLDITALKQQPKFV